MTKAETQERSLDSLLFSGTDMPDHYKQQPKETDDQENQNNQHNQNTYAIVNGAGSDKVLMNLVAYEPEHRILFGDGNDAEALEEAAPWLVKLTRGEAYTEWLLDECFGKRLLLFIQSPEEIDHLAEHFKQYTKIEFPDKENPENYQIGFFSFYDPSIFPAWAKSLKQEEATQFFNPISNIWYEENKQLKLFYLKTKGWQQIGFDLKAKDNKEQAGEQA